MLNNTKADNCCEIDISKCDTFDFMANIIGLPILHPGGLRATEEMIKLCKITEKTKILDVACGRGTNSCYISEKYGSKIIGIDINENLIKEANILIKKKKLEDKIEFKVANAEKLPFPDNNFDLVIFQAVLIMMNNPEKVIKEAIRVTKPGGNICFLELTWKKEPPKEFFNKSTNICNYFLNVKILEGWQEMIFNKNLKEIHSKIYNMACPCTLKELGIIKAMKIFFKQLFNSKIRNRMKVLDSFVCSNDEYFGYGIYAGEKIK